MTATDRTNVLFSLGESQGEVPFSSSSDSDIYFEPPASATTVAHDAPRESRIDPAHRVQDETTEVVVTSMNLETEEVEALHRHSSTPLETSSDRTGESLKFADSGTRHELGSTAEHPAHPIQAERQHFAPALSDDTASYTPAYLLASAQETLEISIEDVARTASPIAEKASPLEIGKRKVDDEDEEEDDDKRRGTPLTTVLLASYASAMTLACLYLYFNSSRPGPSPTPVQTEASSASEISRARQVNLGETLGAGSLEITPILVKTAEVMLRRTTAEGKEQTRPGGDNALWLRLKLKNNGSAKLLPLEKAFVRDKVQGQPDSEIETASGERIGPFRPLPVDSEWSIIGQSFPSLEPGEEAETWVVSSTEARGRATDSLTWRLRLRTGAGPPESIAVKFLEKDIRSRP